MDPWAWAGRAGGAVPVHVFFLPINLPDAKGNGWTAHEAAPALLRFGDSGTTKPQHWLQCADGQFSPCLSRERNQPAQLKKQDSLKGRKPYFMRFATYFWLSKHRSGVSEGGIFERVSDYRTLLAWAVEVAEQKFIIVAIALQKEWAEQSWSTDFQLPKARINSS